MTEINLPISFAEVYWCIADFQSVNSTDIAQKTGLTESTVQRHLRTLEKTGVVKGQGRPKQYCVSKNVASEMLDWVEKFKELARMTPGLRYEELSQSTS
ncbi:winged helix-turn-helix domain-containing protein, partial [Nostoc sp. CCCryo 231-06]|nr:winged helix-turn-helix domain-containing protein [Nostoc sp. CCCryo 231-06]